VALITGGSRGLGLQLARDLAAQGCRIAICARDHEELERARQDLESRGAEVWTDDCDVTRREQVEAFVRGAAERFGTVDIVVANAGVIQVGPVESMQVEDFEQAMAVMFWGVFYTIWSALPYMRRKRGGHIVTITSIGGKISVPHLLPYSCAKFAAVALSEGLRTELRPAGIQVLTVVPGLMRTGSHLNAEFKGQQAKEFAWFGLGASLPGMAMSIERASDQIIRAMRTGSSHCVLTAPAQLAARFHGAFPGISDAVLDLVNRYVLPKATSGPTDRITGHEAERRLNSRFHRALTALGRSAAERTNEMQNLPHRS
jgi:NAD(P)-dependent dehydrogenase (short-subunit alcohol dehydrogenase family)